MLSCQMPAERSMRDVLRNMLQYGDLPFSDFVDVALYHPEFGYYSRARSPVGKAGDFITGPLLSPAFSFAIGNLVRDFVRRDTDVVSTVVDIGCGFGELVRSLQGIERTEVFGIERGQSIFDLPRNGAQIVISNELFDALPFARLVRRGDELHELTVTDAFEWGEREAAAPSLNYFPHRGMH